MKFKFVPKWSGMILYIYDWYWDGTPVYKHWYWRKATDTEAYQVMCLINKHIKEI